MIRSITLAVTASAAFVALTAKETYWLQLNDLCRSDAVPMVQSEYDLLWSPPLKHYGSIIGLIS